MNSIQIARKVYTVLSIISIVLGIWISLNTILTIEHILMICGIFFVVYGVVKSIGYFTKDFYQLAFQFDFGIGIVSLVVGFTLIFCNFNKVNLMLTEAIGLLILLDASFKIQVAIDSKRFGLNNWWIIVPLAIITAGMSIGLLYSTLNSSIKTVIILIGINLCMDGILNLYVIKKTVKTREGKIKNE